MVSIHLLWSQIICLLVKRRTEIYCVCSLSLSLNGATRLKANTSIVSTCWDELTWAPINLSTRHTWQTQNQSFACASNIIFLRFPCARFKVNLQPWIGWGYAVPQHDWKIYCCHLGGWGSSLWELIRLVVCGYCKPQNEPRTPAFPHLGYDLSHSSG